MTIDAIMYVDGCVTAYYVADESVPNGQMNDMEIRVHPNYLDLLRNGRVSIIQQAEHLEIVFPREHIKVTSRGIEQCAE